jgi:hypothetical protein
MGATMNSVNPKNPMQLRSILYGMWLGALLGGVLITLLRQYIYGEPLWLDARLVMRNTAVYVLPLVVVASFTLLRVLVRYRLLHFAGFTAAGIIAGGLITAFFLLAHRVLDWFSEASTVSMAYVFCSAVIVAWSVWLVSRVVDFRDRKRGYAP